MRIADRLFGWLQILSACGHAAGTIVLVQFISGLFVWSLGASIGMFLTGALNLVRAGQAWQQDGGAPGYGRHRRSIVPVPGVRQEHRQFR